MFVTLLKMAIYVLTSVAEILVMVVVVSSYTATEGLLIVVGLGGLVVSVAPRSIQIGPPQALEPLHSRRALLMRFIWPLYFARAR